MYTWVCVGQCVYLGLCRSVCIPGSVYVSVYTWVCVGQCVYLGLCRSVCIPGSLYCRSVCIPGSLWVSVYTWVCVGLYRCWFRDELFIINLDIVALIALVLRGYDGYTYDRVHAYTFSDKI